MKDSDVNREIERMIENRRAGADIHAGDGGYGIGTQEKYDEFVKMRNYPIPQSNTNNPLDFPISPENMRARCEALVTAMVGKELAEKWWNGPNKAFGGDTPEQIYSVAPSAVYAYLMKSSEGEW